VPGFVLLSAIWGGSFALIKVAVDAGVHPVWVAFWRCFFGAVALLAFHRKLPRDPQTWGHAAVVALLLNSIPFVLFAYGETKISSVLAGVWNATVPLATLVFVLALVPEEYPTRRKLLGLATGFAGVLVVLGVWNGVDHGALTGSLACLTGAICYGAAFVYMQKHLTEADPASTVTAQMVCAVGQLLPAALLSPTATPTPKAWLALVVLGALGSGLAYLLNFTVLRTKGPTVASTVTYVIPLWSTLFGFAFLGEPVAWHTAAGGALVVAGVVFTRTR
jgi:drug/metabolite transporter (DMT)-like permease